MRDLVEYGCATLMHVVRLLAPRLDNEDQTTDIDFSPSGIRDRWDAGLAAARGAIVRAPWQGEFDPVEGVIRHEPDAKVERPLGTASARQPAIDPGLAARSAHPTAA